MPFMVEMKHLLEAGIHFGHQTRKWNPKMKKYIFAERNGIYIIDLQKTLRGLREAYDVVRDVASRGEAVLFVGTKKQAREAIYQEATRSGMYYVTERWLGGTLTNFQTIKMSIKRLNDIETMKNDGTYEVLKKKEVLHLEKKRKKLSSVLDGIRHMHGLPGAVFVIDVRKEHIAVAEANKLGIPVIAVVDTNCDPDAIDYVVPGNDDAIRAIQLYAHTIAEAVVEGKDHLQKAREDQREEQAKQDATKERQFDVTEVKVESDDSRRKDQRRRKRGRERDEKGQERDRRERKMVEKRRTARRKEKRDEV